MMIVAEAKLPVDADVECNSEADMAFRGGQSKKSISINGSRHGVEGVFVLCLARDAANPSRYLISRCAGSDNRLGCVRERDRPYR